MNKDKDWKEISLGDLVFSNYYFDNFIDKPNQYKTEEFDFWDLMSFSDMFVISYEELSNIDFLCIYTLRMQPSEIDEMWYYRLETLIQKYNEHEEKKREAEEKQSKEQEEQYESQSSNIKTPDFNNIKMPEINVSGLMSGNFD